jgi:hypothetical protein
MVHKAQHNADQQKVPLLTRKTSKPRTKKMFHSLRFFNPKSKTNTSPHKLSHGTIKKEVLNCFLLRTKAAFCTPRHCLLTKLSLVNTTPFLRYQRKILIFKGIWLSTPNNWPESLLSNYAIVHILHWKILIDCPNEGVLAIIKIHHQDILH